jgi:hypothetical protein
MSENEKVLFKGGEHQMTVEDSAELIKRLTEAKGALIMLFTKDKNSVFSHAASPEDVASGILSIFKYPESEHVRTLVLGTLFGKLLDG